MSKTTILKSEEAVPSARSDKRRNLILQALHNCIIEKGYAKTTLADVARTAGMSPSHLLYYYRGKEAILEHYFQNVSELILARMDGFRQEDPRRQIDLLTKLFFTGEGISKSEIGFMLECFGVAVNDRVLQHEKSELDDRCKANLAKLFKMTPNGSTSNVKDSAELAYAMLIGLRTAVFFDERLKLPKARRLFRSSMLDIAGYA